MIRLRNAIQKYHNLAQTIWPELICWPVPVFTTDLTGTVAAYAYYFDNRIQINWPLYRENKLEFDELVGHEVCHLVNYQLNGFKILSRDHGPEWKDIMRRMGLPPDRHHHLDVRYVKRPYTSRHYEYGCHCSDVKLLLSACAHRKKKQLACPACKNPTKFTGVTLSFRG